MLTEKALREAGVSASLRKLADVVRMMRAQGAQLPYRGVTATGELKIDAETAEFLLRAYPAS